VSRRRFLRVFHLNTFVSHICIGLQRIVTPPIREPNYRFRQFRHLLGKPLDTQYPSYLARISLFAVPTLVPFPKGTEFAFFKPPDAGAAAPGAHARSRTRTRTHTLALANTNAGSLTGACSRSRPSSPSRAGADVVDAMVRSFGVHLVGDLGFELE
jgi:hypothetical protein